MASSTANALVTHHPGPRDMAGAAQIGFGRALILFGLKSNTDNDTVSTGWFYEVNEGIGGWRRASWTTQPPTRVQPAMTGVGKNAVVFGGSIDKSAVNNDAPLKDTWVYLGSVDAWIQINENVGVDTWPAPRFKPGMTHMPDGKSVFLYGGYANSAKDLVSDVLTPFVFDTVTYEWSNPTSTSTPSLSDVSIGVLETQNKIIAYGADVNDANTLKTFIYDIGTGAWSLSASNIPYTPISFKMSVEDASTVLLSGTFVNGGYEFQIWAFSGLTMTWSQRSYASGTTPSIRADHVFVPTGDATTGTLLYGGKDFTIITLENLGDSYLIKPTTVKKVGPVSVTTLTSAIIPSARHIYSIATASLGDHSFLMYGGIEVDGDVVKTDTWKYTRGETNGGWQLMAPASSPASVGAAMTAVNPNSSSTKIVLFGGTDDVAGTTYNNETWIWEGGNWTLVATGTAPSARRYAHMTSIGDGKILLFGGEEIGPTTVGDTWIFDTTNNTWAQFATNGVTDPASDKTRGTLITLPVENAFPSAAYKAVFFGSDGTNANSLEAFLHNSLVWSEIADAPSVPPLSTADKIKHISGGARNRYVLLSVSEATGETVVWVGRTTQTLLAAPKIEWVGASAIEAERGGVHITQNGAFLIRLGRGSDIYNYLEVADVVIYDPTGSSGNIPSYNVLARKITLPISATPVPNWTKLGDLIYTSGPTSGSLILTISESAAREIASSFPANSSISARFGYTLSNGVFAAFSSPWTLAVSQIAQMISSSGYTTICPPCVSPPTLSEETTLLLESIARQSALLATALAAIAYVVLTPSSQIRAFVAIAVFFVILAACSEIWLHWVVAADCSIGGRKISTNNCVVTGVKAIL
jgi:hypothetical protein